MNRLQEAAMDFYHIAANRRNKNLTETFDDYFLEGVHWADARPRYTHSPWISVKEQMPPAMKGVIVCYYTLDPMGDKEWDWREAFFNNVGDWIAFGYNVQNAKIGATVTHWMPVPDLPKGGEEAQSA